MKEPPMEGPVRKWQTRERVFAYATILAIAELGLFAFCVAGSHGLIVPMDHQPRSGLHQFPRRGDVGGRRHAVAGV